MRISRESTGKRRNKSNASVGVCNKYIFRGYDLSNNSAVIQPSVTASFKGFEANIWANFDTNQHRKQSFDPGTSEGQAGFNELTATLSYARRVNKVLLSGGYTHYSFKYWADTDEIFVTAACDVPTKLTLSLYRDINAYPSTYINLSFRHSLDVGRGATLDLGASAGYYAGNGRYWQTYQRATGAYTGPNYSALHDGVVMVGLTIPLSKGLTVQPVAEYWFPLSSEAQRTMGYNRQGEKISYNPDGYVGHNTVIGINIAYGF